MKKPLKDRKNNIMYSLFDMINKVASGRHFSTLEIFGRENLPKTGTFLLVANHTARWDAPVVQQVLSRPANYMTSPNELRGLQGLVLPTLGSFPANPRRDILSFARERAASGEPIVVFPEGDIKRDGTTHHFKSGAAKIALDCAGSGIALPIVPIAIRYVKGVKEKVQVLIAPAIDTQEYLKTSIEDSQAALRALTARMHREICHLRVALGELGDREAVFIGQPVRTWVPRLVQTSTPNMVANADAPAVERGRFVHA